MLRPHSFDPFVTLFHTLHNTNTTNNLLTIMTLTWNKSQHTSLLLWDIDREFQNAYELYEQLQAKSGYRRSAWSRLTVKSQDDVLAKALSLGREVRNFMDTGKKRFGTRFEEGDGA